jgi:hypothetical protein
MKMHITCTNLIRALNPLLIPYNTLSTSLLSILGYSKKDLNTLSQGMDNAEKVTVE